MEKKWKWFLGILALLAFIGGAYLLYHTFADDFAMGGLVVNTTASLPESSQAADTSQTLPSAETTSTSLPEETAETTTGKETPPRQKAPDFGVIDKDGNAVHLSDFVGKPVIINFWASWCPPCKAEMPDFEAAYQKYGEEIHFLIVNMTDGSRETVTTAKAFIADKGYTFPVYFDVNYEAAYAYGVYSLPATYFLDKDGYLVAYGEGALNADILEQGIGMIQ